MGPLYTTNFAIVRNSINPANGSLSQPVTEATYTLDTGPSSNDCYLEILGFNPAGTALYDGIICSGPHGSGSETFNQRSVDLQTGALERTSKTIRSPTTRAVAMSECSLKTTSCLPSLPFSIRDRTPARFRFTRRNLFRPRRW